MSWAEPNQNDSKLYPGVVQSDKSLSGSGLSEDPNGVNHVCGWTALHEAVSSGSSSITLALLRRGSNLNQQNPTNLCTALHLAASKGDVKLVQILLDSGAKLTLKNIDGKTPEDMASTADCKKLLERKRTAKSTRSGIPIPSMNKALQENSMQTFCPKRSHSTKQVLQSRLTSLESKKSVHSGLGEIMVSFELIRRYPLLNIKIWKIKNLNIPIVHNYSHIYVKCYLIPDKNKETKRKTSELRIESLGEGSSSRSSSASSQSSRTSDISMNSDTSITDKVKSVLKKTPYLNFKKNKNEDDVGCVSASIDEVLSYEGLVLRKVNIAECQVHLSICERSNWNSKSSVIADITIPLSVGLKKIKPEWYPFEYKINVPITTHHEKNQMNQSWELKGGQYTGRSVAWDHSMEPTVHDSPSSSKALQTDSRHQDYKTLDIYDTSSIKKHRKHSSKAAKFFKGQITLFKGKQNNRYKKSMESLSVTETAESSGTDQCTERRESADSTERVSCKSVMDQQTRDRVSAESTANPDQRLLDWHHEVSMLKDEHTFQRPAQLPLRYSRAFEQNSPVSSSNHCSYQNDLTVEDVDEPSLFTVQESKQYQIKTR